MASFTKIPANNKQGYKWRCVMEGPPDPLTGQRQQVARVRETKSGAKNAAQTVIDKMSGGMNTKRAKKMKFSEVVEEWLHSYSKSGVKASTLRIRKFETQILNTYMSGATIDKPTKSSYQKFLNDLDNQGYEFNTISGIHATANMIFNWALDEKLREDNPCKKAKIPVKQLTVEQIKQRSISEKYLERNEIEEFLDTVKKFGFADDLELFYLFVFSGMRPGEECALQWPDINIKTFECDVNKTIYYPRGLKGEYELTPPKNEGSIRRFDLDEFIIDMLIKMKERQLWRQKRYKQHFEDFHNGDFVFAHDNGMPYTLSFVNARMQRIIKRTKITKIATPHIWRHTHISMLAEAGVELKTIMKRVGHTDSKTTLKIYTHVTERMKQNSTQRVRLEFKNILEI
ncbi:tyrosine-type recombinase/integrase [Paenibacillus sp. FSL L8-0323]|uniref:tyrosine-type recombinase/integrase n=1 Tax=Paenibacillus sp. FSL L8-0323 TaxID=2975330 RepID=UPI0030FD1381